MKKKKKYSSRKPKKGYIEIFILILAVFGFLLAGGLSSFTTNNSLQNKYLPITVTPASAQNNLQLGTLNFNIISITPSFNFNADANCVPDIPGRCKPNNQPFIPTAQNGFPLANPIFLKEASLIKTMTGQGRYVAWDNADAFANFVISNDNKAHGYLYGVTDLRTKLMEIYNAATHTDSGRPVNPIVILTIWGSETSFSKSGDTESFGCDYWGKGFDNQLNCIVNNVFDTWMHQYEIQPQKNPYNYDYCPLVGGNNCQYQCLYNDPLVFAFEKHNPKCAELKGDPYWTNVVNFYNDFIYAQ